MWAKNKFILSQSGENLSASENVTCPVSRLTETLNGGWSKIRGYIIDAAVWTMSKRNADFPRRVSGTIYRI